MIFVLVDYSIFYTFLFWKISQTYKKLGDISCANISYYSNTNISSKLLPFSKKLFLAEQYESSLQFFYNLSRKYLQK